MVIDTNPLRKTENLKKYFDVKELTNYRRLRRRMPIHPLPQG